MVSPKGIFRMVPPPNIHPCEDPSIGLGERVANMAIRMYSTPDLSDESGTPRGRMSQLKIVIATFHTNMENIENIIGSLQ